jgi:hypothetical protein
MPALGIDGLTMEGSLLSKADEGNALKVSEGYFDDLIGHIVHVDCSSWDAVFASKTWGPDFQTKTTIGEIRQVRAHRTTGKPFFNIYFKDTKQVYTNLDLDYVLKYSPEVPLKYHVLKADLIVRLSRAASEAVNICATKNVTERREVDNATVNVDVEVVAPQKVSATRRGRYARVKSGREKKRQAAESNLGKPCTGTSEDNESYNAAGNDGEFEDIDLSEMEPEFSHEIDDENTSENEDFGNDGSAGWGAEVEEEKMEEDADDAGFINWQFSLPPLQVNKPFTGAAGPKHGLSPEKALPIDYFNLFIPMFFWIRIAQYTNAKADMTKEEKEGKMRHWTATSGAEIKAFIASVIWWCICKSFSFEQFFKHDVDSTRVKKWFPSWTRWCQIKRFLKVSDPSKDEENKHDRMFKVRELFDYFINACRASYWPNRNIALDEAVKKFKGRCIFKQYIKNKPVKWGIKFFCVCCSATSYLFNAMFYVGKRKENEKQEETSVTHQTVKKLYRSGWVRSIDLTSTEHISDWKCELANSGMSCFGSLLSQH